MSTPQQHVRRGERRDGPRQPRADHAAAVGRAAVAGQLGVAGPSGPRLRVGRADRRRTLEVQRRQAIEPIRAYAGLNSADGIKATASAGRRGAAAHRRAGPRRRRRRHHHRHRLDQRGRGVGAGVHVQRQHRDRVDAVLVPAELAVVPGRQGERPPGRSGAVRGRRRAGARNARGTAPEAGGVRREPRLVRRRGAVPVAEQPHRPHRRRAVLRPDVQQHHLGRPDPQPRPGLAGVAAHLRQGRERPLRRASRTTSAGPTIRGAHRGRSTCSTRRIRSPGGTPICCSQNRTGCANRAATTCRRGWSGSRW